MPRHLTDNLTNWKVPVSYIYANPVNSVYGESGFTYIYTHSRSHKDMMNMLNYVIEKNLGPYTELDPRKIQFGTPEYVGPPERRKFVS